MTFKTILLSSNSISAGKSYRQFNEWLEAFLNSKEVEAEVRFLFPETLTLIKERDALLAKNAVLERALVSIQNEYGAPNDEDNVTTTAREALEKARAIEDGK